MEKRVLAAAGMIGIGLLLVLGRLVHLAVLEREDLAREAADQHRHRITVTPRRGTVMDRNGVPLALSMPAESLFVRPRKLPQDAAAHIPVLAATLNLSPKTVARIFQDPAPFVWLKRQATPQEAARVRELRIAGIDSMETQRRFYPQGSLAGAVLGFSSVDGVGLEGIELAYDRSLRGESVEVFGERDALGRTILPRGIETPPKALNVRLTLDASLQYIAELELDQAVRKTRALAGTVVMLDPKTSAVLALAQAPTFDPNTPAKVAAEVRRSRALTDYYEPGSTLKTLLAAAALDANVVRLQDRMHCGFGSYQVGRHTINDHHRYGWLSFTQVLQKSSNIGAAKIGERLGKDTYDAYLRAFGLGRLTGIDLLGETPGLLFPSGKWSHINLVTASFGQGIAVTPLQLTNAYSALANGGMLMQPHVVSEVLDAEGHVVVRNGPRTIRQVVRPEVAGILVKMLETVVEKGGTGTRAHIEGFRVAGKTGTSQKISPRGGYSSRRIASFVGMVPADQPRLVMLVVIDEPKTGVYGGEIAAPVFQAIAQQALAHLGVEGEKKQLDVAPAPPAATTVLPRVRQATASKPILAPVTPVIQEVNFAGMSLRAAMLTAQQQGLRALPVGSGYVTDQSVQSDPNTGESVYTLLLTPTGESHP